MANSGQTRQVLEEELRLVLEQKATIEARLAQLQGGGRPNLSALKTGKRPGTGVPSKTHVPPTKKQKVQTCTRA